MPTTTDVSNLVINKLTKAQYENIPAPSDTELYFVTDDILDIESGGTGADTAIGARENLRITTGTVAPTTSFGENNDIYLQYGSTNTLAYLSSTSPTTVTDSAGNTKVIPVIGGGTGATTTAGAINALNIYPVGSIYLSVNNVNPSTLFGGTWERIKDRFLLSAGDTYQSGATGGEATHTLTVNEMPSHTHSGKTYYDGYAIGNMPQFNNGGTYQEQSLVTDMQGTTGDHYIETASSGGGKAHNNMPPYLVVYMWKRTA